MPYRSPPNRSEEYRMRAAEVRAKAETADGKTREGLLQDADTWERMAAWEEANNPKRVPQPNVRTDPSADQ